MKTLKQTIAKIVEQNKPPVVAKTPDPLKGGDFNPFQPRQVENAGPLFGFPAGGKMANPMGAMPPAFNPVRP